MKRLLLACMAMGGALCGFAQTDSSAQQSSDTVKVGGMIIVKKPGAESMDKDNSSNDDDHGVGFVMPHTHHHHSGNISTDWGIVDIGFANYNDKTNYGAVQAQGLVSSKVGKDEMGLRSGKSVNVNIWFFMQRINLVKHVVNLKYGLGLELNNYRYNNKQLRIQTNPTYFALDSTLAAASKNKLAADYVTVPMMLDFNLTPDRNRGIGLSVGVSAGYLYSSRQKTKVNDQKTKVHDSFGLDPWKLSYIAELNLGLVHFYGSYAFKSMWTNGLDQVPYNVGIRLGYW